MLEQFEGCIHCGKEIHDNSYGKHVKVKFEDFEQEGNMCNECLSEYEAVVTECVLGYFVPDYKKKRKRINRDYFMDGAWAAVAIYTLFLLLVRVFGGRI